MKISLTNFRCYDSAEFDFGSEGLVLLSGPSGSGKTTILLGIYFALYGTGTKLVSYGKKSCSVTLVMSEDLTITRSKRPNRLIVNGVYEDAAGQAIIDQLFGDSFKTTGYISQKARDSLILMSPTEKLGFLEKFAFNDVELGEIKKRSKDHIKERSIVLARCSAQLEMIRAMSSEVHVIDSVKFPLDVKKDTEKYRKGAATNHLIHIKNNTTLLKRNTSSIRKTQKKIHTHEVVSARNTAIREQIASYKQTKISTETEIEDFDDLESLTDNLNRLKDVLKSIVANREAASLQKLFESKAKTLRDVSITESADRQASIDKLKDIASKHEYTMEECDENTKTYTEMLDTSRRINKLKKSLFDGSELTETVRKSLHLLKKSHEGDAITIDRIETKKRLENKLYNCPGCHKVLRFKGNSLQSVDVSEVTDMSSDNLHELKMSQSKRAEEILSKTDLLKVLEASDNSRREIKELEDEWDNLPTITSIKDDLREMMSCKNSISDTERRLKELQNVTQSSTVTKLIKDLKKAEKNLDTAMESLCGNFDSDYDETDLRYRISSIEGDILSLKRLSNSLDKIQRLLSDASENLVESDTDIDCLYEKMSILEEKTKELDTERIRLESITKELTLYDLYDKSVKALKVFTDQEDALGCEESEIRTEYAAAMLLKEKILEAESIAMASVISSINVHARGYLDWFFPDNPISVQLVPFKESKNGRKPQINLQIEYKGQEADLATLSGGEFDRILLAFALALGEISATPLMILDEAVSSLDQDLVCEIVDGVKQFPGNLVVFVGHQVVTGVFDRVITLE
jgi:DNA repair exonuclease SbcCD ATPase subunit